MSDCEIPPHVQQLVRQRLYASALDELARHAGTAYSVEYTSTGAPHTPEWLAAVIFLGREFTGTGSTKAAAKDAAAFKFFDQNHRPTLQDHVAQLQARVDALEAQVAVLLAASK